MSTLLRWIGYALHLPLWLAYGVLHFVSKPGTRYVMPVLLIVACFLFSAQIEAVYGAFARAYNFSYGPDELLYGALCGLTGLWVILLLFSKRSGGALLVIVALGWWMYLDPGSRAALLSLMPGTGTAGGVRDGLFLVLLVVAVGVTSAAYALLSIIVSVVLGIFPPPSRPARPRRTLTAKKRVIVPAGVRVIVPALPARGTPPMDELHTALPPQVVALLPPPRLVEPVSNTGPVPAQAAP